MPPVHPAAELFPLMDDEQLAELAEDIRANGLIHPVVIFGGRILDGRNRWRACERAGVQPTTTHYGGDSPVAYAISVNQKRRHLTPAQRASVAAEALPLFEEEAKAREREGGRRGAEVTNRGGDKPSPPRQRDESKRAAAQAAKATGAGVKATQALAGIKRAAPEVFELAKSGTVGVSDAKKMAALDGDSRANAVSLVSSGVSPKEAIAAVREDAAESRWAEHLEGLLNKMRREIGAAFSTAERIEALCEKRGASVSSPSMLTMRSMLVAMNGTVAGLIKKFGGDNG